jgi:hypothetical protein
LRSLGVRQANAGNGNAKADATATVIIINVAFKLLYIQFSTPGDARFAPRAGKSTILICTVASTRLGLQERPSSFFVNSISGKSNFKWTRSMYCEQLNGA